MRARGRNEPEGTFFPAGRPLFPTWRPLFLSCRLLLLFCRPLFLSCTQSGWESMLGLQPLLSSLRTIDMVSVSSAPSGLKSQQYVFSAALSYQKISTPQNAVMLRRRSAPSAYYALTAPQQGKLSDNLPPASRKISDNLPLCMQRKEILKKTQRRLSMCRTAIAVKK